ncbi:MAG: DUF4382 domain-containing protein [Bacteroidia bacterium]
MNYKTLKLILAVGIGTIIIVAMLTSCEKPDSEERGQFSVQMTDAPGDFLQVNVDVKSVEVHYSNQNAWTELSTKAGVYNLLDLQNEVTVMLTDTGSLPTGKITQVRLILGEQNNVMLKDSSTFPLTIPSSENTGIKINLNTDVLPNQHVNVLLDFDAALSVHQTGMGEYKLQPVILVKRITTK